MNAQPRSAAFSLLREMKDLFDLSDQSLATLIGTSRPHVQAVLAGRYAEYLNARQRQALLAYARLTRDEMIEAVARLEALS